MEFDPESKVLVTCGRDKHAHVWHNFPVFQIKVNSQRGFRYLVAAANFGSVIARHSWKS